MAKIFHVSMAVISLFVAVVQSQKMTYTNPWFNFHGIHAKAERRQDSVSAPNSKDKIPQHIVAVHSADQRQEELDEKETHTTPKSDQDSLEPIAVESSLKFQAVNPRNLMNFRLAEPIGLSSYREAYSVPFEKVKYGSWDYDRWPSSGINLKGDYASPVAFHDGYMNSRQLSDFDYLKNVRVSPKIPSPDLSLFSPMIPRDSYLETLKLSEPLSDFGYGAKYFEKGAAVRAVTGPYGQHRSPKGSLELPVYGRHEVPPRTNRNPELPQTVFRKPGMSSSPVVAATKHSSPGTIKENPGNLLGSPRVPESFNDNRGTQKGVKGDFRFPHEHRGVGETSHGRPGKTGFRGSATIPTKVPPVVYDRPEEQYSVNGKRDSQHYLSKSVTPLDHSGYRSSRNPVSPGHRKSLEMSKPNVKHLHPPTTTLKEGKSHYPPESKIRSGFPSFDDYGLPNSRWPSNGQSHFVPERASSLEAVKEHQFKPMFLPGTNSFIATKSGRTKEVSHPFIPEPEASQVFHRGNSGSFLNLPNYGTPSKKPFKPDNTDLNLKGNNYGKSHESSTFRPLDQSESITDDDDDDETEDEKEIVEDTEATPLAFSFNSLKPKLFWDFRNKSWATEATNNNEEKSVSVNGITKDGNVPKNNSLGIYRAPEKNYTLVPSVSISSTASTLSDIISNETFVTEATHLKLLESFSTQGYTVAKNDLSDGISLSSFNRPRAEVSISFKESIGEKVVSKPMSDDSSEINFERVTSADPEKRVQDDSSAVLEDEIYNFTSEDLHDDSTIEIDPDSESWSDHNGNGTNTLDSRNVSSKDTKQDVRPGTSEGEVEFRKPRVIPQSTSYTDVLRLGDKVFGARKFPNKIHSQSSRYRTMYRTAQEQRVKEGTVNSTIAPRYVLGWITTPAPDHTRGFSTKSTGGPVTQTPSIRYETAQNVKHETEENLSLTEPNAETEESEITDDSYSYDESQLSGTNETLENPYSAPMNSPEQVTTETLSDYVYPQYENDEEYRASIFREDSPFFLGNIETSTRDHSFVTRNISSGTSIDNGHDPNDFYIQKGPIRSTPLMSFEKEEVNLQDEATTVPETQEFNTQREIFRIAHETSFVTTVPPLLDNERELGEGTTQKSKGTTAWIISGGHSTDQMKPSLTHNGPSLETAQTKPFSAVTDNPRSQSDLRNSSSEANVEIVTPDPESIMVDSLKTMRFEMEKMMTKGIRHVMPLLLSLGSDVHLSSDCTFALFRWIKGIRMLEQWAVKMADASSKVPEGVLYGTFSTFGSYDECVAIKVPGGNLDRPVKGQYCSVNIRPLLPQNHRHFTIRDAFKDYPKMKQIFQEMNIDEESMAYYYILKHRIGLCIPSACNLDDVENVTDMMATKLKMNITVDRCETSDFRGLSPGQIITIVGMSLVACIIGLCTIVDVIFRVIARGRKPEGAEEIVKERSSGRLLCRAFSAYRNSRIILATSVPANHVPAIHGVKFLSLTWVMLGHVYYCKDYLSLAGLIKIRNLGSNLAFQVVLNSAFAADTFFFISGFLVVYTTLRKLEKRNASFTLVSFYIRRYCRLTPAFLMASGLILLGPLAGSGPIWNETLDPFVTGCQNYWWTNILYFSNFVRTMDTCVPHGWYLSCELQFYLISPIIILALHRRPKMGIMFLISGIVLSALTVGILTYLLDLPPVSLFSLPDPKDIHEFLDIVGYKPYTHYASYCVGMATGYLLVTKQKLNLKKVPQMLGWCIASIGCCLVVYGTWEWNSGNLPGWPVAVAYASSCRTMWSLGIAWLIIVCAYGYGGIVNRFLSWAGFVPLSRLTFIAYLIHPLLMYLYASYVRSPFYFSQYVVVYLYFGHLCLTFGLSFFLSLAFEMPFISMEKMISRNLDRQRRRRRASFSERPENFQHPEHPEIKDAVVLTRRRNERIYF